MRSLVCVALLALWACALVPVHATSKYEYRVIDKQYEQCVCTSPAWSGTQAQKYACYNKETNAKQDTLAACQRDGVQVPTASQSCKCYDWGTPSSWGACDTDANLDNSVPCGSGTRTRSVSCMNLATGSTAEFEKCNQASKPAVSETCTVATACPVGVTYVYKTTGAYGACTSSTTNGKGEPCGSGTQSEVVACYSSVGTTPTFVKQNKDTPCVKAGATSVLASMRACTMPIATCVQWEWKESGYGSCTVTTKLPNGQPCGTGTKKQTVTCQTKGTTPLPASDDDCIAQYGSGSKPLAETSCQAELKCAALNVGDWSSCSGESSCGYGVMSRTVACKDTDGGELTGEAFVRCLPPSPTPADRPESTRTCFLGPCCDWKKGEWSTCSKACFLEGEEFGRQTRSVQCVQVEEAQGTLTVGLTAEGGVAPVLVDERCCLKKNAGYKPKTVKTCNDCPSDRCARVSMQVEQPKVVVSGQEASLTLRAPERINAGKQVQVTIKAKGGVFGALGSSRTVTFLPSSPLTQSVSFTASKSSSSVEFSFTLTGSDVPHHYDPELGTVTVPVLGEARSIQVQNLASWVHAGHRVKGASIRVPQLPSDSEGNLDVIITVTHPVFEQPKTREVWFNAKACDSQYFSFGVKRVPAYSKVTVSFRCEGGAAPYYACPLPRVVYVAPRKRSLPVHLSLSPPDFKPSDTLTLQVTPSAPHPLDDQFKVRAFISVVTELCVKRRPVEFAHPSSSLSSFELNGDCSCGGCVSVSGRQVKHTFRTMSQHERLTYFEGPNEGCEPIYDTRDLGPRNTYRWACTFKFSSPVAQSFSFPTPRLPGYVTVETDIDGDHGRFFYVPPQANSDMGDVIVANMGGSDSNPTYVYPLVGHVRYDAPTVAAASNPVTVTFRADVIPDTFGGDNIFSSTPRKSSMSLHSRASAAQTAAPAEPSLQGIDEGIQVYVRVFAGSPDQFEHPIDACAYAAHTATGMQLETVCEKGRASLQSNEPELIYQDSVQLFTANVSYPFTFVPPKKGMYTVLVEFEPWHESLYAPIKPFGISVGPKRVGFDVEWSGTEEGGFLDLPNVQWATPMNSRSVKGTITARGAPAKAVTLTLKATNGAQVVPSVLTFTPDSLTQSYTVIAPSRPGLFDVSYVLGGPSAADFIAPQRGEWWSNQALVAYGRVFVLGDTTVKRGGTMRVKVWSEVVPDVDRPVKVGVSVGLPNWTNGATVELTHEQSSQVVEFQVPEFVRRGVEAKLALYLDMEGTMTVEERVYYRAGFVMPGDMKVNIV